MLNYVVYMNEQYFRENSIILIYFLYLIEGIQNAWKVFLNCIDKLNASISRQLRFIQVLADTMGLNVLLKEQVNLKHLKKCENTSEKNKNDERMMMKE